MTTQEQKTGKFYCETAECKEQCFDCMADVGDTRKKTKALTGEANSSPARQAYLNWVAAGKPQHPLVFIK
jgi:hypothetical protein